MGMTCKKLPQSDENGCPKCPKFMKECAERDCENPCKGVPADKDCERVDGGKDANGCRNCDTARIKCQEQRCKDQCMII